MIKAKFLAIFFLLVILLSSPVLMAEEAEYGGTLYLSNDTDWDTLDPAYASGFDAGEMAVKFYDGLVRFDFYSNKVVPALAESWEVSDNNQVFTFNLRSGVKFHDGREFTAQDVKYTFDRLYNPEVASPGTWVFPMIKGTEAALAGESDGLSGVSVVDDYTVRFELDKPFGLFLTHLTLPYALIVNEDLAAEYGEDFSQHPVGTGPFKFVEWEHDNQLVMEANEDYWEGRPYVDQVVYRVIPQPLTDIAEFEAGNLDRTVIPNEERERWINNEDWTDYITTIADLSTYYLALNSDFEPLDKPEVREAIDYAINSEAITHSLFPHYVAANDAIPEGMPGGTDIEIKGDTERAKELLAEAGYPDGFDLDIWVSDSSTSVRIGGVIQALLGRVGIRVNLIKNDWSVFYNTVKNGNAPAYYLSWWADYADPYNFLNALYTTDRIPFNNEEINSILEEMVVTTDSEERIELSKEIIRIAEEVGDPYIYLYHTSTSYVKQPWIKGDLYHQMYSADKLLTWWIDQDVKAEYQD
jgi:peptide/nickel transport system substrate-binding protein/oligopeptide transport system substrate-binding protein